MDLFVSFRQTECCECHVQFAMTKQMNEQRIDDHKAFYCPNGHRQYYVSESDLEATKRELAQMEQIAESERSCCNNLRSTVTRQRNQINGHKGQNTKLKNKLDSKEKE